MSEIPCPLWHAALRFPQEAALIDNHHTINYAEYNSRVTETAAALIREGIGSGDRVGICLPNSVESIIVFMAILRAGAIACPISGWHARLMIGDLVERLRLRTIVCDGSTSDAVSQADVRAIAASSLTGPAQSTSPHVQECSVSLSRYNYATIVQTSGSSGEPKSALHSYANHYYSALGSNENIRLDPGDRWLLALALHHVGGFSILFRCLLAGAAVVIGNSVNGLPDVADPTSITHCSLVPTQVQRMLDDPTWSRALAQGKAVLVGGAALPEHLIEAVHEFHWPLFTTYGMTETSSQHTTVEPGAPLARLYTSGRLLPYRELTVSPEREILVRGRNLFLGYVDGDRIDPAVDAGGWFHTGDIGEIDRHGYLTIRGRRDNMFISGGENIHPEAIERALRRLADVEDAIVVPVTDDEFGERPFAFLKMASSRQFSGPAQPDKPESAQEALVAERCRSGEFREALSTELPRYMIPAMCAAWPLKLDGGDRMKPERARFRELAEQLYRRRD